MGSKSLIDFCTKIGSRIFCKGFRLGSLVRFEKKNRDMIQKIGSRIDCNLKIADGSNNENPGTVNEVLGISSRFPGFFIRNYLPGPAPCTIQYD